MLELGLFLISPWHLLMVLAVGAQVCSDSDPVGVHLSLSYVRTKGPLDHLVALGGPGPS